MFVTVDKGWRCAAMCAANKLMGRQLGTIQPRKGPPSNLSMPMSNVIKCTGPLGAEAAVAI